MTIQNPREGSSGNPAPSLSAETEALKEAYDALNRGDIPGFVRIFDEDVEWIEFLDSPSGGTYRGLAAVQAHFAKSRDTWAEGRCEPERFIAAGDKIIVFDHVRVRLKHETEWREGRIAGVYTFRNGKVIQARVFTDRQQALQWAS